MTFLGWFLYNWLPATYEKASIQTQLADILTSNPRAGEAAIADITHDRLRRRFHLDIEYDDIVVSRSEDGKILQISITYTKHFKVPLMNSTWDFEFSPSVKRRIRWD